MRVQATCEDCGVHFTRAVSEYWKRLCYSCWLATRADVAPKSSPVEGELRANLRALRQLCHPDRHGGSALATRVSQWLNGLRERLKTADQC